MGLEELEDLVRQRQDAKRWRHTQGCMILAENLARQYSLDIDQARLAALLHDAWRSCDTSELIKAAELFDIEMTTLELRQPVLLHGPLAAAWARDQLHIDDEAILEAVRCHNTGAPGMGPLAMLLYVVDALEPGRAYPGADRLRAMLSSTDLRTMALQVVEQSLRYQLDRGEPIAPETVLWRNELLNDEEIPNAT